MGSNPLEKSELEETVNYLKTVLREIILSNDIEEAVSKARQALGKICN